MEIFNTETKQIKMRGAFYNGTIGNCSDYCRDFTVREALESTFNGDVTLTIPSTNTKSIKSCDRY
jgi:hypothetical protein